MQSRFELQFLHFACFLGRKSMGSDVRNPKDRQEISQLQDTERDLLHTFAIFSPEARNSSGPPFRRPAALSLYLKLEFALEDLRDRSAVVEKQKSPTSGAMLLRPAGLGIALVRPKL